MMFGRNLFYFVFFFFLVCVSDDSMRKTAKEYFELLNKGIRPEKPVPFFPQPRIFKRSVPRSRNLKKKAEDRVQKNVSNRYLQMAKKTSGESLLNHKDGQHGNDLSGKNRDGEDEHKVEDVTRKNGDGEDEHKEEDVTRKNGDGEDEHKLEDVTRKNGDGGDEHKVEDVTRKNGDGEDGHKVEDVTQRNGDGEDEHLSLIHI